MTFPLQKSPAKHCCSDAGDSFFAGPREKSGFIGGSTVNWTLEEAGRPRRMRLRGVRAKHLNPLSCMLGGLLLGGRKGL